MSIEEESTESPETIHSPGGFAFAVGGITVCAGLAGMWAIDSIAGPNDAYVAQLAHQTQLEKEQSQIDTTESILRSNGDINGAQHLAEVSRSYATTLANVEANMPQSNVLFEVSVVGVPLLLGTLAAAAVYKVSKNQK